MSFENRRAYSRHILQPLSDPSSNASQSSANVHGKSLKEPPTTSNLWESTTHTFVGTVQRVEPKAWPASRFTEDPALIPDDASHDMPYDPSTAKAKKEDTYHMYDVGEDRQRNDAVPLPRLVVKRYLPTAENAQHDSGITLLMLPGMGIPKEMLEPTLEILMAKLHRNKVLVQEAWIVDMPMCGQTAQSNPRGYLYGNEKDIARDLLLFTTGYLPLQAGEDLPENLPFRRPNPTGPQQVRQNLHVVAHSLGAQAAMLCAAHAPSIFASLSVLDPAIIPPGKIRDAFEKMPKDVLCAGLKATYPSREALKSDVKQNRRTKNWDDSVVDIFVDRGAVEAADDGSIKLVAHPRLEWALYYDKETPTQCFDRLTDITTPFNAIMPSKPFAVPAKMFEATVGKMEGKTRISWLKGTTHQIVFEKVEECASLAADWIIELVSPGEKAKL